MQTWLFATLGKIAGIGGIALGVFLTIYTYVLHGKIQFGNLCPDQAYHVALSIIVLTFGISVIGIIAWLISRSQSREAPLSTTEIAVPSAVSVPVLVSVVAILLSSNGCGPPPPSDADTITPPPSGPNTINIKSAIYASSRKQHGIPLVKTNCQGRKTCAFWCNNSYVDHGDPMGPAKALCCDIQLQSHAKQGRTFRWTRERA